MTPMSEVRSIKGIDDETWAEFKSLAAQNKMRAADMFRTVVKEYRQKSKNFWEEIRAHKPIFSPKEYEEIEKRMKEFRKEYGWRI
jgi:predicted secreted protein